MSVGRIEHVASYSWGDDVANVAESGERVRLAGLLGTDAADAAAASGPKDSGAVGWCIANHGLGTALPSSLSVTTVLDGGITGKSW